MLARSLLEARIRVAEQAPDLVILDRRLPDGDGLQFLPELRALVPTCVVVVVMVTAHGDIASAVDAMRAGAADYLAKPVELADLVMKARRSADNIRLRVRAPPHGGAPGPRHARGDGDARAHQRLAAQPGAAAG